MYSKYCVLLIRLVFSFPFLFDRQDSEGTAENRRVFQITVESCARDTTLGIVRHDNG